MAGNEGKENLREKPIRVSIPPISVHPEEQNLYPDPENHHYACPRCGLYLRHDEKKYHCDFCGYTYYENED